MSFVSHTIKIEMGNFHFWRSENQGQPVLVMLHGVTDSGRCWWRTAKRFSGRFDCIMPDFRGHGLSDAPPTGYGAEDHAQDILELMDQLKLEQVILIGHSMGGAVATYLAAKQPQRFQALILEDPAWFNRISLEEIHALIENDMLPTLLKRKAQTREDLIAENQGELGAWHQDDVDAWVDAKQQVRPEVLQYFATHVSEWQPLIQAITCPILLFHPNMEKWGIISPQMAQEAQTLNPKLQTVYIAEAGHSIRRDEFEQFMEKTESLISNFLK